MSNSIDSTELFRGDRFVVTLFRQIGGSSTHLEIESIQSGATERIDGQLAADRFASKLQGFLHAVWDLRDSKGAGRSKVETDLVETTFELLLQARIDKASMIGVSNRLQKPHRK